MTLINISDKIINIGSDPVLPSETRSVNKAIAELPSVKAFIEKRLLQIVDEGKAKPLENKAADNGVATSTTAPTASAATATTGSTASGASGNGVSAEDDKKASQTKKK